MVRATVSVAVRRCLALAVAALLVAPPVAALAGTAGGPLSGTWAGYITPSYGRRQHIVIVVNARETGGSWRISATCHGPLTLDSISNGYHHFLRHRGRGTRCAGGDIDCLKRAGRNVYDAVTARPGGGYGESGTLRRVRV